MPEFLQFCLARYGEGFNPITCTNPVLLQVRTERAVRAALAAGKLRDEAKALAARYLDSLPW